MNTAAENLLLELVDRLQYQSIAGEWLTNEGASEFTKYSIDYLVRNDDFIRGVHYSGEGRNRRWNRQWLNWWLFDRDNPQQHLKRIAEWEAKSK